jgi:hypothetical protein
MFLSTHNPLFFTNSDISTYVTLKNSIWIWHIKWKQKI